MAKASWKLCSMSGLQTPSASLLVGSLDLERESLLLESSEPGPSEGLPGPGILTSEGVVVGPKTPWGERGAGGAVGRAGWREEADWGSEGGGRTPPSDATGSSERP